MQKAIEVDGKSYFIGKAAVRPQQRGAPGRNNDRYKAIQDEVRLLGPNETGYIDVPTRKEADRFRNAVQRISSTRTGDYPGKLPRGQVVRTTVGHEDGFLRLYYWIDTDA